MEPTDYQKYEKEGLEKYAQWVEDVHDPLMLAKMAAGWRSFMKISIKQAAEFLDMPPRTLEGVEQGRGFRYPLMLIHAMIDIDKVSREARGVPPQGDED